VNAWQIIGIWFTPLLGLALSIAVVVGMVFLLHSRRKSIEPDCSLSNAGFLLWPGSWLVIKSRDLFMVQLALGLRHPKPCSWLEGLAGEEQLFIAPPVKGWILATGRGLPDPCEDADACFRFILNLSRKVGEVQCFSASRILHHHAWIKAKNGRIVRAYAWAGKTLWNQGSKTPAEEQLALKCYGYTEPGPDTSFGQSEEIEANVDKVPLLAARWSFDPTRIDKHLLQKESGIAGEPACRY
jgi:hypothetical protein